MPNLKGIPNNLELGRGRVKPCRSSFNSFFALTDNEGPETFVVAPRYNLSLAGTCLVDRQPAHNKELIRNKIKKKFIGFVGWMYLGAFLYEAPVEVKIPRLTPAGRKSKRLKKKSPLRRNPFLNFEF